MASTRVVVPEPKLYTERTLPANIVYGTGQRVKYLNSKEEAFFCVHILIPNSREYHRLDVNSRSPIFERLNNGKYDIFYIKKVVNEDGTTQILIGNDAIELM